MLSLPTPSHVCGVGFDPSYWIVTLGDAGDAMFPSDPFHPYVSVVFKDGKVHDSYLVVGESYITLPFEK